MDDPKVCETRNLGGFTQWLIDYGFGVRWYCNCPEFMQAKPNTAGPFCEHTNKAAWGREQRNGMSLS